MERPIETSVFVCSAPPEMPLRCTPCPFCGGRGGQTLWRRSFDIFCVVCRYCGATGSVRRCEEDAIAAWEAREKAPIHGLNVDEQQRLAGIRAALERYRAEGIDVSSWEAEFLLGIIDRMAGQLREAGCGKRS